MFDSYYTLLSYPFALTAFFLITFFSKEAKLRQRGFLNTANLLIFLILLVNLIGVMIKTYQCRSLNADYSHRTNCSGLFWFTLFTGFLFQLVFLWKTNRMKVWITLVSMLLVVVLVYCEILSVLIDQYFNNYYETFVWINNETGYSKWLLVPFAVVYFIICWIAAGFRSGNQAPKTI